VRPTPISQSWIEKDQPTIQKRLLPELNSLASIPSPRYSYIITQHPASDSRILPSSTSKIRVSSLAIHAELYRALFDALESLAVRRRASATSLSLARLSWGQWVTTSMNDFGDFAHLMYTQFWWKWWFLLVVEVDTGLGLWFCDLIVGPGGIVIGI